GRSSTTCCAIGSESATRPKRRTSARWTSSTKSSTKWRFPRRILGHGPKRSVREKFRPPGWQALYSAKIPPFGMLRKGTMDTKELLKKVRKIEIKTRRLSDHVFGGEYHSTFKGRGMTFSEVRQYQYGDDVRNIDWNVTARYNEPFVKVYEEERELTMMLMVDVSGSELFGTVEQFKNEIVTEIAATLAFSATQNNDKIGLILFSDKVELYIPQKKGRSHVLRIIRELIEFEPESKQTNFAEALKFLSNVMKKKAIVFVLSDFIADDYHQTLKIVSGKHDVTGIKIGRASCRERVTI